MLLAKGDCEHFGSPVEHITWFWEREVREGFSEGVTLELSLEGQLSKQI